LLSLQIFEGIQIYRKSNQITPEKLFAPFSKITLRKIKKKEEVKDKKRFKKKR